MQEPKNEDPDNQDIKNQDPKNQDPKNQDPKNQDFEIRDPKNRNSEKMAPKMSLVLLILCVFQIYFLIMCSNVYVCGKNSVYNSMIYCHDMILL